jgi:hypothetical protein
VKGTLDKGIICYVKGSLDTSLHIGKSPLLNISIFSVPCNMDTPWIFQQAWRIVSLVLDHLAECFHSLPFSSPCCSRLGNVDHHQFLRVQTIDLSLSPWGCGGSHHAFQPDGLGDVLHAPRLARNVEVNVVTHDPANLEVMQRVVPHVLKALYFNLPPLVRYFTTFLVRANLGSSV